MNYPKNSIKGIPNNSYFHAGTVGAHLFYFKQIIDDVAIVRDDGAAEESINWEDDECAIDFTLNQRKKNGDLQFGEGVAIIPRSELDRLSRLPAIRGLLSYERSPLDDNPYHGNLLLPVNVPKPIMKLIAGGTALGISGIITQNRERLF